MDIQKFLDRIQYDGSLSPTLENLAKLIRCHLETVPFENLDSYSNPRELSVKPEDLFAKVVDRHRGGVCFELNGLMYWALGELGYERYPVSVRILRPDSDTAPITHQGNVVVLDEKRYYCDVGFGGPGPKGVLCLDDPEIQIIAGEAFRVSRKGVSYHISRSDDGQWHTILRFADIPSDPADFEILLFYFTANPHSHFVCQRIVNLCTPSGSLALTGCTFTKRDGEAVLRRELTSEEEVSQVLKAEFGLVL